MTYLVLARKYRPQTFEEIVGQKHVARTLQNAIARNRVAHAFLFTGTRGVGKTTVARILAKALNCDTGPTARPCNQCDSCKEISAGTSMDVLEIDGASNTGVDDVRELREKVKYLPSHGRYKIVIIDEVHMLTNNAFNALLKTLEEPPPHVIFIFATTDPHKIPDTILSRVQQYDFKTIPMRMIFDHLKDISAREGIRLTDEHLMLIARKAEGSIRDALSLLDQAVSYGGDGITTEEILDVLGVVDRGVLFELSEAVLQGNAAKCLEIMRRVLAFSYDTRRFFFDLLEHFRNLVAARILQNPGAVTDATDDELARYKAQAAGRSPETLLSLFDILVQSEDETLKSSNPSLVLEMALVRLATLPDLVPLGELLARVEGLKNALVSGKREAAPVKGTYGKPVATQIAPQSNKPPEERSGRSEPSTGDEQDPDETASSGRSERGEATPEPGEDPETRPLVVAPSDIRAAWESLIAEAKSGHPHLAPMIAKARPSKEGNRLIIEMDSAFSYNIVRNDKNLRILSGLAEKAFGPGIVPDPKPPRGAAQESAARTEESGKERDRRRRREAMENPTVRDALEIFDGEIVEIQLEKERTK